MSINYIPLWNENKTLILGKVTNTYEEDGWHADIEIFDHPRCRHNKIAEHYYGMEEEPDFTGGEVMDIALFCEGPING